MSSFHTKLAPLLALIILSLAVLFTLLAFTTAYWSELRQKGAPGECVKRHRGLWRDCQRFDCNGGKDECKSTVADVSTFEDWYYSAQVLETLAFILIIAALVLWILWCVLVVCLGGSAILIVLKVVAIILLLIVVIFHFIAIVVWACKDDYGSSVGDWKLCWSWILAIFACLLAMAAMVFIWMSESYHVTNKASVQVVEAEEGDSDTKPGEVYTIETEPDEK